MAASKLSIYQGACLILGERKVMSLTENREARRAFDDVWDRGGVRTCLQNGLWNHGIRTYKYEYSPSVEPEFGFRRAFNKPDDWVRTVAMCEDEYFRVPLLDYQDEGGYWYADLDTIYARFVSDDTSFGMDYSKWGEKFTRYVEYYFAWCACYRITQDQNKKLDVEKDMKKALDEAKSTDAMDEATVMLPPGSWSKSRYGRRSRLDRGSRTRFLG